MRNTFGLCAALILALAVGIGCSAITDLATGTKDNSSRSKSETNSPESALREKTGVPECDALLDSLADQSKTKDDNYVTRAAKEFFFNQIRQSIKENAEKNKNDTAKMAKGCIDIKKQLDAEAQKDKNASKQ